MVSKAVRLVTEVPGPRSRALFAARQQHIPRGPFNVTPIFAAQAEGARLTDVDGNTFLDFAGGIGVLNVGHAAPPVVAAAREQLERFTHTCFHVVPYEAYVAVAERLNGMTPGGFAKKTVLFNSGAEAVENAIKIARSYTGRPAVLCFEDAFHGRTLLALSLTSKVATYKKGFGPFAPEVYRVPYAYCYRCPIGLTYPSCRVACADLLREVFNRVVDPDAVAALIVEPVLGEGGFVTPPREYLPKLQKTCAEHGILLIADEVQTGFGRTGKMFAVEHAGVEPDLLVMAKSMAGGLPLSAVTGRAEIMDAPQVGGLGGTFGGNPVSCAAALAALDLIERQDLPGRAARIGARVLERFHAMRERYELVGDVRGLGAMVAMELVRDRASREPAKEAATRVVYLACERGLILITAGTHGNVIRTLMPLVTTDAELDEGLDILEGALRDVDAEAH